VTASALSEILGHEFENARLLNEALRHPSAMTGGRHDRSYERLEFLGDRVLGVVMADLLFNAYPEEDEGALSRRFVALVRRETLVEVAEEIRLADHILLAPGEDEAGSRDSPAVLADSCEAVIAALYLDGGLVAARRFIERYWAPLMDQYETPPKDAKTSLQEWAQGRGKPLPDYEVLTVEGPAHEPTFTVSVRVAGFEPSNGCGPSKRAAEQDAAAVLLERIAGRNA